MGTGIRDVDSSREDTGGDAASGERPPMGSRVNAERAARHDGPARVREFGGHGVCQPFAIGGRCACSD